MITSMVVAKYLPFFLPTYLVGRLNAPLGASPIRCAKGSESIWQRDCSAFTFYPGLPCRYCWPNETRGGDNPPTPNVTASAPCLVSPTQPPLPAPQPVPAPGPPQGLSLRLERVNSTVS